MDSPPRPGASPAQKYPSTSSRLSPASASAPRADSGWSLASDVSSALRVGCSKIPAIYALPLMVIRVLSPDDLRIHRARFDRLPAPNVTQDGAPAALDLPRPVTQGPCMFGDLLVKNVRPMAGAVVDVLVSDGI